MSFQVNELYNNSMYKENWYIGRDALSYAIEFMPVLLLFLFNVIYIYLYLHYIERLLTEYINK